MSYVDEAAIVPRARGLTVEQAMTGGHELCAVCHRRRVEGRCACRSHPDDFEPMVSDTPRRSAGRKLSDAEINSYVQDARTSYLDRDWHAIEHLIRALCS